MNLTTGKFTAPRAGTYAFSFTGMTGFPASSSRSFIFISMFLNGNGIGNGLGDETGTDSQRETFSFQSILNLLAGDQLWLQITNNSTGTYLHGEHYTHFSGYLLEENHVPA